jgi:hypothetical protein
MFAVPSRAVGFFSVPFFAGGNIVGRFTLVCCVIGPAGQIGERGGGTDDA